MALLIGNRYEIQAELGTGGMGTVYLGLDKQTGSSIAIKQLKAELSQPEMLERFKREGQALRELNHPNIVKLLDTIEANAQHYLIMEYVAGGDLRQLLQNGKLPYQRCLNIAIDLADALTRAHRLNIIHRDLKPANVLVSEDGTIRLTDFGVAHVLDKERVTETDAIVGTLDYLPPEVLNGDVVEPRSDIWAFGVMLFEMLAGQRPFSGNGYLQTLNAIATAPIPDLERLAPDAPIALVDLVYRMLCRDQQARISSVRHVGAELEDILHGRGNPAATKRFETPIPDFRLRPKHNLPAQTTPFVGRENELIELARLVQNQNNRLISIIAQGGMGKTRLSLEAAERLISHFEHGVFFVELAPLSESSGILPAIANALGYQFQNDGREPKQQICDYLQAKEILLVLDNFEHLLDAAGLVSDLLKATPKLKILVTSRQRLDQHGESLFHLSGMDFPAWETPADALNYASVKLFMNSAVRAKPDFELTTDNLDAVARICKLVQGMPLGIVLAAAWLGMLSPEEVASELKKGLDFLETDSQQIPERQRSMRAVMDYSWQQMNEAEQAVFAKLSVFHGGFTREAAEAVAGANLRILMSLVNKSLLHRDSSTGRYEIHELLRQYAEERVEEKTGREAHSHYFAQWMQEREAELKGSRDLEAVSAIRTEFENVKAGWYWAVEQQHNAQIEAMLEAFRLYIVMGGQEKVAKVHLLSALPKIQHPRLYAEIHAACGIIGADHENNSIWLRESLEHTMKTASRFEIPVRVALSKNICMHQQGFEEANQILDEALEFVQQYRDNFRLAEIYFAKGVINGFCGGADRIFRVREFTQKALDIYAALGSRYYAAKCHGNLGVTYALQSDYGTAIPLYTKNIGLMESFQGFAHATNVYLNLTLAHVHLGQYEEALETANRAYQLARDSGFQHEPMRVLNQKANILSLLGRHSEADSLVKLLFSEDSPQLGEVRRIAFRAELLLTQGLIAFRLGNYPASQESLLEALALTKSIKQTYAVTYMYLGLLAFVQGNIELAEDYYLQALKQVPDPFGRQTSHAIYGIATLLHTKGQSRRASEYAAFALNHKITSYEFRQYTKELLAKLQSEMSAEDYQAAYERGKSLDLDKVVQQILSKSSQDSP